MRTTRFADLRRPEVYRCVSPARASGLLQWVVFRDAVTVGGEGQPLSAVVERASLRVVYGVCARALKKSRDEVVAV